MPYNERFDEGYAKNWGIAVISSKNKGYIQAFATANGMRSFYFDSRTFYIENPILKSVNGCGVCLLGVG